MTNRIAIVRGEESAAATLRRLLEAAGYRVETAGSVFEALSLSERSEVDLAVLDARTVKPFFQEPDEGAEEQRLPSEALLDAAIDYVFMLDSAARFTCVNRAAVESIAAAAKGGAGSAEEVLGHGSRELGWPAGSIDEFEAHQVRALTGETIRAELPFPAAGGARRFEYILSPVYRGDGSINGVAGIARDVEVRDLGAETSANEYQLARDELAKQAVLSDALRELAEERDALRQTAEERLAKLQVLEQLKDEFIIVASHDLKGPLTSISVYSQLLLRQIRRQQPDLTLMTDELVTLVAQVDAFVGLLDNMLDASRIQAGAFELLKAPCDLDDCLASVLDGLSAEERQRVDVTLDGAPLAGHWEQQRIEEVLANLIRNALKYSPASERVNVTVGRRSGGIEVAVGDHGMGISAAELPQLFERFYRTPQARASGLPGTGLGLYICKGIVASHGGRLWAESAGEGQGSTFRFLLPDGNASATLEGWAFGGGHGAGGQRNI